MLDIMEKKQQQHSPDAVCLIYLLKLETLIKQNFKMSPLIFEKTT